MISGRGKAADIHILIVIIEYIFKKYLKVLMGTILIMSVYFLSNIC